MVFIDEVDALASSRSDNEAEASRRLKNELLVRMSNCEEGVMYHFVNKSENDHGIVVQHKGGEFGAKSVPQFGVGTCFCMTGQILMCG